MKTIILLLISLFVFSINLNNKQATVKKQNDTFITAATHLDDSAVDVQDIKMSLESKTITYHSDIVIDNLSNTSVINSIDSVTNNDLFITYMTDQVINPLNIVQRVYTAKTIGLQYINSMYLNIYLLHSINKLGFT